MRILLVSHAGKNPHGGASRVYHLLEEGLKLRGHSVKTLHLEDFGISGPTKKIVFRMFLPHAASKRTAREKIADYDVIMTSNGMLYPLFRQLRQRSTRPLLVNHLHGLSFFDQQARLVEAARGHLRLSWIYRNFTGPRPVDFDRWGSQYADLSITQNDRDLDFILEQGFGPVVTIPLPVHPEILAAGYKAPSPEARNPRTLLWFGSWLERKGRQYLPGAFRLIAERFPAATLTIGGSGQSPDAIMANFTPELRSHITVLPRVTIEEQVQHLGNNAIFLFPSISEGFGFALLEGMSMGMAAVTTSTGMGGDWLCDRDNAMVVPASSSFHLAKASMALIEDDALRCSVARKGQELSRAFTQERMIDEYEAAFEKYRRH